MSISRSQYGSCSTAYYTSISILVVCKSFGAPALYQIDPALTTKQPLSHLARSSKGALLQLEIITSHIILACPAPGYRFIIIYP